MWIQVRTVDGTETHTIDDLSRLTKIECLREKIQKTFCVSPDRQRLFYRGKQRKLTCEGDMALQGRPTCSIKPVNEESVGLASIYIKTYGQGIELICQKQKEFVKSSVESKWNLAEAQQKLGSLALHNSESTDQEYAKAQTEASELRQREEEWRRKEAALIQRERQNLWNTDSFSKEVFNKSFISQYKRKEVEDEDISKSFIQKHEQKIRYFGMLGRWDDSQRFLSDHPYLVCEETAKYLILWCFHLEAEQKRALMEQIAHQAVVMQFIIEMARSCNVDPRGCFRLFFQKAKAEEEGYLEAFKTELEAFKSRVRICSQSQGFQAISVQNPSVYTGIVEGLESLSQNANDPQGCINRSVCNLNSMLQKDEEPKMMDTV